MGRYCQRYERIIPPTIAVYVVAIVRCNGATENIGKKNANCPKVGLLSKGTEAGRLRGATTTASHRSD